MPNDNSGPKLQSFPTPPLANNGPALNQPSSSPAPVTKPTPASPMATDRPTTFPDEKLSSPTQSTHDDYDTATNPEDTYTSPYPSPQTNLQNAPSNEYSPEPTPPTTSIASEEPKFPVYSQPESTIVDDPLDLTDPIAPEMTNPEYPTPQPSTPIETAPTPAFVPQFQPPPGSTPITPNLTPASIPNQNSSNGKFVGLLLGLIAIGAIAAAVTIFLQLGKAQSNLNIIKSTKDNQQTIPSETPTESITPSISPTAKSTITPSAKPTVINVTSAPQPTIAPTATPSAKPTSSALPITNSHLIFERIGGVLAKATEKVATAKLLMITVEDVSKSGTPTAKFWFRESATKKSYFYILSEPNGTLTLFDKQIYVTPDNNIPELNTEFKANKLGTDLEETLKLAKAIVIDKSSLSGEPISATAHFIKATTGPGTSPVTLWQISYKYADRSTPVVIQISSQTKQLIFTNIKYTVE